MHFIIVAASEGEHGNVKAGDATKRYFQVYRPDPIGFDGRGELVCRFTYRPDPQKTGQDAGWRERRNAEAVDVLLDSLHALAAADPQAQRYLQALTRPAPTEKDPRRPLLARYINQYTARNSMDYFIHKDLGGFLRRELDFYIKNEVIRLDDIEHADAPRAEQYLVQVRVLRAVAGKLIDFLAQLEDFQKKLWLKKKFVVETNYCITLDRILAIEDAGERDWLLAQIAANDAQREEWVDIYAIESIVEDTTTFAYSEPLQVSFLVAHPYLIVDTVHFGVDFKASLQDSCAPSLAVDLGGTLIHGENYQALRLLHPLYNGNVKCVYLDPPYNTSEETFIYKNSYKHSSWISMMADRVSHVERILSQDGAVIVAIDDEELYRLKLLLDQLFDAERWIGTIVVQANPRGRGINSFYATSHEYGLVYSPNPSKLKILDQPLTEDQAGGYRYTDEVSDYRLLPFRRSGGYSTPDERPNSEFSLYYSLITERVFAVGGSRKQDYPAVYEPVNIIAEGNAPGDYIYLDPGAFAAMYDSDTYVVIMPVDTENRRRVWRWSDREKILEAAKSGDFVVVRDGAKYTVQLKDRIKEGRKPKTIWAESKYDASSHGTNLLQDMLGDRRAFGYPKSLHATKDMLYSVVGANKDSSTVMDMFGGSGTTAHAIINLNRSDGGKRTFVLAEIGDYFTTVLVPRIKKAAYSQEWEGGKPTSRNNSVSISFKYLRLESYEDCLNNLEFQDDAERQAALDANPQLAEEHLLHYMLDVETAGSASLLNLDGFADPTAYRLKVKLPGTDAYEYRPVDLLETFNYLLGLRVQHIAAPQTFAAQFVRPPDQELPEDQQTRLQLVPGSFRPDPAGPWSLRTVEGWLPADPDQPQAAEADPTRRRRILIVWRKLTGDLEQDNLVLDEWFRRHHINPRDREYDTIYVNGSNNLPNLSGPGDTWKVRLIEEDFLRLMWDTEGV